MLFVLLVVFQMICNRWHQLQIDLENKQKPGLLMLIDFEKGFNAISWKIMYNVWNFLGFPSDYINWIKPMNKKFTASLVQARVRSAPITIAIGCRHYDPTASYLFIFLWSNFKLYCRI